jgi:hypothetical protein
LHKQRHDKSAAIQKEKEEKEKWFNEKFNDLVKRAEEFKTLEANAARLKIRPKVDPPLLNAGVSIRNAIWKAYREMSNLVAGKRRLEQAFIKWENTYCKLSLENVHLAEQIKKDRDEQQQLYADQITKLSRHEIVAKNLKKCISYMRNKHEQTGTKTPRIKRLKQERCITTKCS